MKKASYIIAVLSSILTLGIGVYSLGSSFSLIALGFILWGITPYLYMLVLVKLATKKSIIKVVLGTIIIISLFGLSLLVDIMFIHPDAQGGLVLIFGPVYQWLGLLLASVILGIMSKRKNA